MQVEATGVAMLGMLGHIWGGPALYRQDGIEVRDRRGVRTLHLGSETIQSAMQVREPDALELAYTRAMMAFLLFVPAPERALMIGLGGGSLAKFVYRRLARTRLRVVEIDPRVVEVARRYFAVPADDERLRIEVGDGAVVVGEGAGSPDVLLVDAYDGYSLARAFTVDAFYVHARAVLAPAGVFAMNLWSSDGAFDRNLQRIERAFEGRCLCLPAERPGNVIVLAFAALPAHLDWAWLSQRAESLKEAYGLEFPQFVRALRKMNQHDAVGLQMESQGVRAPC